MGLEWKEVRNFEEKYLISNSGEVLSLKSGKIRPSTKDSRGYQRITLWEDNRAYTFLIHRLVADAFIPNPENKPTVNHIDGDPSNNNISNLEWATYKEQTRDAINRNPWDTMYKPNLKKQYKFMNILTLESIIGTPHELAKSYNLQSSKLFRLIRGERKTHKNWIFEGVIS